MPLRYFCIFLLLVVSTLFSFSPSKLSAAQLPAALIKNGVPVWQRGNFFVRKGQYYIAEVVNGREAWVRRVHNRPARVVVYNDSLKELIEAKRIWKRPKRKRQGQVREPQDPWFREPEGNLRLPSPEKIRKKQRLFSDGTAAVTLSTKDSRNSLIVNIEGPSPVAPKHEKLHQINPSTKEMLKVVKSGIYYQLPEEKHRVFKRIAAKMKKRGVRTNYTDEIQKKIFNSIDSLTHHHKNKSRWYTDQELLWALLQLSKIYEVPIPNRILKSLVESRSIKTYVSEGDRLVPRTFIEEGVTPNVVEVTK